MLTDALVIFAAYLVGSIPFSFLMGKLVAHVDIREEGEGNVGSRNVMHIAGPVPGVIAGLLDAAKGVAVYFLVRQFGSGGLMLYGAALAVVLGHEFPVWLRWQGGKGMAPAAGFLAPMFPWAVLAGLAVAFLGRVLLRDFNIAVAIAAVSFAGLSILERGNLQGVALIALMFGMAGIKKLIDLPHERAIRAKSGWIEGRNQNKQNDGTGAGA